MNAETPSRRLSYHTQDQVNGLDVRFFYTAEHLKIFLEVHSGEIPAYGEHPNEALVKITQGKHKIVVVASRFEGGQRLLLPESIYPQLLSLLKTEQKLKIQVPGYATEIESKEFSTYFEKIADFHSYYPTIRLPI